jgi:hypothetical protein
VKLLPYATWSKLWDLIKKPPAAIAVYLALLRIYFAPERIDRTKDYVLSQLLEHELSAEELKIAQEALEVFIELIKREKSAGTDIRKLLKSIEQENYELFKKALYNYLRKDALIEEIKRIVYAFTTLRTYVSESDKTDAGSYEIHPYPPSRVIIEVVDNDYIIKDLNISMKRLRELGFFTSIEVYGTAISLIIPAPYIDMDILKLFEKSERVGVERPEVRAREVETVPSRFAGVKPSRSTIHSRLPLCRNCEKAIGTILTRKI